MGTPERLGRYFALPEDQVAAAIAAAGLEPWGRNYLGQEVWRLRDVDAALGGPRSSPAPAGPRRSPAPEGPPGAASRLRAAAGPQGPLWKTPRSVLGQLEGLE